MGYLDTANRTGWPSSLSRDRNWPRVTKCTHLRVVGLRQSNAVGCCCRTGSFNYGYSTKSCLCAKLRMPVHRRCLSAVWCASRPLSFWRERSVLSCWRRRPSADRCLPRPTAWLRPLPDHPARCSAYVLVDTVRRYVLTAWRHSRGRGQMLSVPPTYMVNIKQVAPPLWLSESVRIFARNFTQLLRKKIRFITIT